MRQHRVLVRGAGKFFHLVGVVGQGAQLVVHGRGVAKRILSEPYAVVCRGARIGVLRMGNPRSGGIRHAVLVGYQHMFFARGVRGDAERHVRQMLHGAAFRFGEGKVAAGHLLGNVDRLPGADVLFAAFGSKGNRPGFAVLQVASGRLQLFYRHGSERQRNGMVGVVVEFVAFYEMVLIECELARLVGLERPGAFRGSRARASLVVVAYAEQCALQRCGAQGVGLSRFRIDLLPDKAHERILRCIGNACRGGGARGYRGGGIGCGCVAFWRFLFADCVGAGGQQRAGCGFAVGTGDKLGNARAALVEHAEHGSFKRIAVVVFADGGAGRCFGNLQIAAEVLLYHGLHIYRLVADKPQAVARATGVRGSGRRDVHVVDYLACFDVHFLQGCHVIGPYVGGRGGAGQRAGARSGVAFQPASEARNGELGRVHAPGGADVAAPVDGFRDVFRGVERLYLAGIGNLEQGVYAGRFRNRFSEIERGAVRRIHPTHELPAFLRRRCGNAAMGLFKRFAARHRNGEVVRFLVVEGNAYFVVGFCEGAGNGDAFRNRGGKPVELGARCIVPLQG